MGCLAVYVTGKGWSTDWGSGGCIGGLTVCWALFELCGKRMGILSMCNKHDGSYGCVGLSTLDNCDCVLGSF